MSDLLIIYFAVGLACGVAVYRRTHHSSGGAIVSVLVTIPLWPLWAPFVLMKPSPKQARAEHSPDVEPSDDDCSHPAEVRIQQALQGALDAARTTGLEGLLSEDDARQIMAVVTRVCARLAELDRQLVRCGHDPDGAVHRIAALAQSGASERALAAAQRHARSLDRLRGLHDRDAAALGELAELCELLRAELLLARYGAAEDLTELKTELVARLDALAAA